MSVNLNFILSTLNSLILLYFFHTISYLSIKKLKSRFSKYFTQIFVFFLFISFVSIIFQIILVLDYKFFFQHKENIKIIFITIIYLNFFLRLTKIKLSYIIKFFNFGKKNFWIYLFLVIFFLCSIGIVSDADSLIYHSKISKIINSGFQVNYFYDNPHYLLVGSYEIFNVLPEILGINNFNTILNCYFLLFFIKFIFEKFDIKKNNSELFVLIFISTPLLTIILTPQKSFFVPLIIQFLSICFIIYKDKFIKHEYIIVISALILTTTFKLNFILSTFLILLIFLFKDKSIERFKFFFKVCLIISLIYLLPHYYFKIYYFDTPFPPFLNQFIEINSTENIYSSFSNDLKEWKKNSIFFPLGLFLNYYNDSFSAIHNSLGIGIISFLFIKKANNKNLRLIFILIIGIILLNFLFVQKTPRFYFLPYLVSLLILFEVSLRNTNILKKIIYAQLFFTLLGMLILATISITTTFLDSNLNTYKKKFIFRYAAYEKINEIVGEDKFIIVDLPNYYSNNYEISTILMEYISNDDELKEYKNYIDNNNVSYFFSVNVPIEKNIYKTREGKILENFFTKCFTELLETFTFDTANRKKLIFNNEEKIKYYVYKKTKGCKFN